MAEVIVSYLNNISGVYRIWYFRKMDSLAGQQLVKADGSSVNADDVLADKVNFFSCWQGLITFYQKN